MTRNTDQERAEFEAWLPNAYRQPQEVYTVHNMEVAFIAGMQAARRAPAEPVISEAQVLAITTAYEQGVGKGHQSHAHKEAITNPYGDEWGCDSAWQMGYDEGREQAERKAAPHWDGVIKPSDFIVETFRRGASVWVPKPANCVRIVHRPTGLFEEETAARSVHANKAAAWQRLSDRLKSLAAAPQPQDVAQASVSNGTLAAHVMLPCVERIDVLEVANELKENISAFGDTKDKAKERAAFYLVSQHEQLLYWQQQVRDLLATGGWVQADTQAKLVAHPACKPDMLVNGGALNLALNVLRRAGKNEVADELEATAVPQSLAVANTPAAPVQMPEPAGWRDPTNLQPSQGCTYMRAIHEKWPHIYREPLYTEQQVRDLLAGVSAPAAPDVSALVEALEMISDTDPDEGTAWFHEVACKALAAHHKQGAGQ